MSEHLLKTWPEYFRAVADGSKTFEIRVNDRDFAAGDILVLQEFDPKHGEYTGQELQRMVGFIIYGGQWGIADDMCVMSLLPLPTEPTP